MDPDLHQDDRENVAIVGETQQLQLPGSNLAQPTVSC